MVKHLQKIILAAVMLLASNGVWAYDFSAVNNGVTIYYNIISNTAPYTVEVTNNGRNNSYHDTVTIPSSVTYNGITYSVTSIGRNAFSGCTNLTSVTVPNSVTSIGNNAFSNCTHLRRTNYNGTIAQWCRINFVARYANPVSWSRNLYINNSLITNLTIPNTVDTIKQDAFCRDTAITSVTIPNSVTNIGDNAFSECTGLTSVTIPNSITCIGGEVFWGCTGLTSVTIPNSVTSIGYHAFAACTGLTSVTIPNSVTSIGDAAFNGCTGLTSVTIPNSVTSIGYYAFSVCTGLTSVTIGNSVTSIGAGAFESCTGLTQTNYTGTIAQWCGINFASYHANPVSESHNLYINNSLIANLVIPNAVDTIKDYAFGGDTAITSVTIPNSVTCIGDYAFDGCSRLTSVTIPNSVTNIGILAFAECTSLTSVTIGNSVTNIGFLAFENCDSLRLTNYTGTIAQWCGITFHRFSIQPGLIIPSNPVYYSRNLYLNNTLVTNLVIPDNVDTIKDYAFVGDTAITSITFRRSNTVTDNSAFSDLPTNIPVYVPCSASSWYIAKLSNFLNFYETLPFSFTAVVQDTTMGSVTTVTAPNCNNGAMWTIRATANTNYVFSRWSDGDTNAQRTIIVNRDTALTAYFTSSSQQWYNFVVISEDTNKGSVQIVTQPTQASPQATIIALPNTGYTFARWSDGNTQNPRSLTVTQDTTLVAYFTSSSPQWYNFVVMSEDTNKGRVQIVTQPTQASPQATIIALPNTGYTFARWSDGNTQNPRSLTVTQDTVLVACFTQSGNQWFNFAVVSEDPAKGTVQVVTQPTQENPQAIIVALPNTGYTFTRWSDGNTQNPRTLTVTQDTVLIAFFASNQGIAEAENDNISVRTVNGHILLEGVSNERVYVSDVLGRVVYYATVNERAEIAVRKRGVYFVKVGNRPAQKVVVVR